MRVLRFALAVVLGIAGQLSVSASDVASWPAWRGSKSTGAFESPSAGDAAKFPTTFDSSTYRWKIELPGKGCSTPIIVDQNILVTAPIDGKDALLCYDVDGAEHWRVSFGAENAGKHRNGSGSNASPISDGEAVFVYYKSGAFAAVELDGQVRWKTDLVERFGKDTLFWDHGTSPVLTEKHVIMARMHQGESWLAAFDKKTGELAWKVARNYTTPTECDHGYTTPLVIQYQNREAILVWGAEHITIHRADKGEVMWSCGNFNPEENKLWPAIATPVVVDNTVVVAYGRNDRGIPRLHGVRLEGTGDVTATNHLWMRDDIGTFVPTPAVHGDHVLVVGDQGEVEQVEPATGKTVWKDAFPKHRTKFYASPLVAGETLYAPREDGMVFVASLAGDKFTLLAENDMGESIIASPVPLGTSILLRGEKHLFCVGPAE